MKLSKSSLQLQESPLYAFFRKVNMLKAAGREVISLGVGEPAEDTADVICQAGICGIREGKTRYVPVTGSADLKQSLAVRYGVQPGEVVVSHGAKTVLSVALQCLIDPGDSVLIPAPYYPPFIEVVKFLGATPVLVDTLPDKFKLTFAAVEEAIGQAEKQPSVLVLNSPNNPTGVAYAWDELEKIVQLAQEHGIAIVSDECYSNFAAEKDFSLRQLSPEVVVVNSVSKTSAMTGWRIGWAVAPAELAGRMELYLNNFIGCPSSVSERAALEALRQPGLADFVEQRQLMHAWLDLIGAAHFHSEGGFYAFADFSHFMEGGQLSGSVALAEYLLEKAGVAVTPGVAFGDGYDKWLRLSFPISPEKLNLALDQMGEVLKKIQ